jgi:hypothetical protein
MPIGGIFSDQPNALTPSDNSSRHEAFSATEIAQHGSDSESWGKSTKSQSTKTQSTNARQLFPEVDGLEVNQCKAYPAQDQPRSVAP